MYPSWTNEQTLEMYRKMTPNYSGVWKDMVGVTNHHEADYCVVIDYTAERVDPDKTIYIGAHPFIEGYNGYKDLSRHKHKLDLKDTFGFGEWWLKYDYDYLSALEPMDKTKDLCCIMSNTDGKQGQTQRKIFIKELAKRVDVHIYGRIEGIGMGVLGSTDLYGGNHCHGKEDVLAEHRYSIEIDIGLTRNYFSERFFDSLLMWCMPLYWGSTNVEEYIPARAFKYIDIYDGYFNIFSVINSNKREQNLDAIAEARHLLLNKYQIWARVYEFISNNPLLQRR